MPTYGTPYVAALIFFGLPLAPALAVAVHLIVPRYWIANAVFVALVLAGCVLFHRDQGRLIPSDIAMLYGIGGASGLAISALAGLPVRLIRRARDRSSARRLADRWDARERRP